MNEAKKWTPDLNVVRFHGPKTEREKLKGDCRVAKRAAEIDIIVTTYETFVSEHNWFKRAFTWNYCILDEGHKIKNSKSNVSQALYGIRADHRLLLTGTPLQNDLQEMWALLQWLYSDVFTEETADKFKQAFNLMTSSSNNGRHGCQISRLPRLLARLLSQPHLSLVFRMWPDVMSNRWPLQRC